MNATDQDLVREFCKNRSEKAFGELVSRHLPHVLGVASRVTGDHHLSQDVAQEIFTHLARKAPTLVKYRSLSAWLHTATRGKAIDALRSRDRSRKREEELQIENEVMKPNDENWDEVKPVLDGLVSHLQEDDRQAVLLRYYHRMSHAEVGRVLGIAENTARMRTSRALEKLRELLSKKGVTTTAATLATTIPLHAMPTAPIGLASSITTHAISATATTSTASLITYLMNKHFLTAAGAAAAASVITASVVNLSSDKTTPPPSEPAVVQVTQRPAPEDLEQQLSDKIASGEIQLGDSKILDSKIISENITTEILGSGDGLDILGGKGDIMSHIKGKRKEQQKRVLSVLSGKLGLSEDDVAAILDHPVLNPESPKPVSDKNFRAALAEVLSDDQLVEYDNLVTKAVGKKVEQQALKDFADFAHVIDGLTEEQKDAAYNVFYEQRKQNSNGINQILGDSSPLLPQDPLRASFEGGPLGAGLAFGADIYGEDADSRKANAEGLANGTVTTEDLMETYQQRQREKALANVADILTEEQLATYDAAIQEKQQTQTPNVILSSKDGLPNGIIAKSFSGDVSSEVISSKVLDIIRKKAE